MTDLARIKSNVAKMAGMGAPEADIDAYIAEEGTTVEAVRAFKSSPVQLKGSVPPQTARPTEGSSNIEDRRPALPRAPLDFGTATAATINGLVDGVPVIGPMARDLTDRGQAGIRALMGENYGTVLQSIQDRRNQINEAAPIANIAGQVGGGIGAFGAAAKVPAIADALGLTGTLAARAGKSALSGGGISAADQAVRGGNIGEVVQSGVVGAGVGGAVPVVGAAVRGAIKAGGRVLGPTVNAILRPEEEALRRSGTAYARDAAAGNAGWGASDEVAARSAQIPVLNADRGGETVRALTRSVANQSPEARQTIAAVADDRFAGQGQRAADVVRAIAGGRADDLGYQDAIKRTAQMVNRPAYDAAFNAPGARAVWNRDIVELMQSDTFRGAINAAEKRGTDRAAVDGFKAVRNPFEFLPDGSVTLKTNPDGSRALPSLQFWDQVKRNIDGMIGTAQRQGDNTLVADLTAIKRKLVGSLDTAVPQYAKARAGAALFFDAEDALDAGRKFGSNMRMVPEAKAAFGKFTEADKDAFRTGYASTLIDRIMASGDRTNVINQVFKSQASREMVELVFGAGKARQLEAYVRAETLADLLRGAMGNSTTARQLMEMGLGGGAGYVLSGGDLGAASAGVLATKGARMVGQRVDNRVMQEVAKLLTSNDPTMVQKAVFQATMSAKWMDALEEWGRVLAAPARGTAMAVNE